MTSELDETVAGCISRARGDLFQPFNIILPGNDVSLRERIVQALDAAGQSCSGISFYSLEQFVRELLTARGLAVLDQPLIRRYLALEGIIHSNLPDLEYFDKPRQLREGPGYAAAFSSNIRACEQQGLNSEDLKKIGQSRVRDLAKLWARADRSLGWGNDQLENTVPPGCILQRFLIENEENDIKIPDRFSQGLLLTEQLKPVEEKVLGTSVFENFILLNLLTPLDREEDIPSPPDGNSNALGQLKSRIFRPVTYKKTVSVEKEDDSVRFEEYSVPEREDEAAVQWLLHRLEEGDNPRELGIVFASGERSGPLYSNIRNCERLLSERRGETVKIPLFIPAGISLAEVPAGTRVFALIRALKSFLRQDEMVGLLPLLRFEAEETYNASSQLWKNWIYNHGMVGGSPSRPDDAERWPDYLEAAIMEARQQLAAHERDEAGRHTPSPERLERRIKIMELAGSSLRELIKICHLVQTGETGIRAIWNEISKFAEKWLDTRQDGRDLLEVIDESIRNQFPPANSGINGEMALRILLSLLREEKFPFLESDANGVFLGNFAAARFRSFKSLRFIGLNENTLPAVPREDPVLPDRFRHKINRNYFSDEKQGLADSDENAGRRLRSFYHLLQSVQNQIVFTSCRRDREQTRRAASSLFIDLALASGKSGESIPSDDLIKQEMQRGRRLQGENGYPLSAGKQVNLEEKDRLPSGWQKKSDSPRQLTRMVELLRQKDSSTEFSVFDGVFKKNIPEICLNGLTEQKPLSAGAAGTFLSCPHQFLLNRVLGFYEPEQPAPTAQLSPLQFGSLLHEAVEQIYSKIDPEDSYKTVLKMAESTGREIFEQKAPRFGLVGEDTKKRQKDRFLTAVKNLIYIDNDKNRLGRRFELERQFGFDEPVREGNGLFIRGIIDRVEHLAGGSIAIRDLKSGKKRSDADFLPGYDIQLGVYRLDIIGQGAGEEQIDELSFIYPIQTWSPERLFAASDPDSLKTLDQLARQTDKWLALIGDFLKRGLFPRTEDDDDCSFCPFKPICGSRAQEKFNKKLEKAEPEWADQFLARKEES